MRLGVQILSQHFNITSLKYYNIAALERDAFRSLEFQPTLQHYNVTTFQHCSPIKTCDLELKVSANIATLQHDNITTLQPQKTSDREFEV